MGNLEKLMKAEDELMRHKQLVEILDRTFEKAPRACLTRENWMELKAEVIG